MKEYNEIKELNKAVELNKINKERGVKMENTNKNQNNYMGGDFEHHLYNDINEFVSDNDSYNLLDTDNFIDNMEDNPSYLAFVVEKTAEDNYIEETDVGGADYYKLCLQIITENIPEDMKDDVIDIIRNLYI